MATTWKNEKGDWSITNFETPTCFGCSVKQGKENERGEIVATPSRMAFTDHTKTEVQCTGCKRVLYKEVA